MGLFENLPYTNLHELNLSWFLKTFRELLKEWEEQQQEFSDLKDAWHAMQDWINDYFDNLDVQQEINNKLEEMYNDGRLALILNTLFADFEFDYNDRLDVLESRMDSFVHLTDGSTTGDAELADIRIGANGTTYATAGDAVRGQIDDLSSALLLDRDKAARIETPGDDFNNYITPGNYYVPSTPDAEVMVNIPEAHPGRLTVLTMLANVILQTYDTQYNRWWRTRDANLVWTDWEQMAADGKFENYYTLDRDDAVRIETPGDDFDSYTTIGNYYVPSTPDAETMVNIPEAHPGRLTVLTMLANVLLQTYETQYNRWWRTKDGANPWSAWICLADTARFQKYFTVDRDEATRLSTSGTDVDSITTAGNYVIPSTALAESFLNMPYHAPGRLTVIMTSGSVLLQTYDTQFGRWWRTKDGANPWTDWLYVENVTGQKKLYSDTSQAYGATESVCVTDRYIYLCEINSNTDERILKFDKFTMELLDTATFTGQLGHANGITWNPDNRKLYVAVANGTRDVVIMDEDMTIENTVTVNETMTSLSGIGYDPVTKLFAVYAGNKTTYIMSDLTQPAESSFTYTDSFTAQDLDFKNGVVYLINNQGRILAYSVNGYKMFNNRLAPQDLTECESLAVVNHCIVVARNDLNTGELMINEYPARTVIKDNLVL